MEAGYVNVFADFNHIQLVPPSFSFKKNALKFKVTTKNHNTGANQNMGVQDVFLFKPYMIKLWFL